MVNGDHHFCEGTAALSLLLALEHFPHYLPGLQGLHILRGWFFFTFYSQYLEIYLLPALKHFPHFYLAFVASAYLRLFIIFHRRYPQLDLLLALKHFLHFPPVLQGILILQG